MPRTAPAHIVDSKVMGAPIQHAWSSDLALKFVAAKDQNVKLYDAVDSTSFKAKMSIGIAVSEWTVWRFDGHANVSDAHQRIEAAWASAIDPRYAKDLRFKLTRSPVFSPELPIDGPLKLAVYFQGDIYAHYATGNIYLAEPVVKQAMLARHVIPNRKAFDGWLADVIRRAAGTFPRGAPYDENSKKYDASGELPVPREFLEPGFVYTEVSATDALRAFLQSLDPKTNPYLNTSDDMKTKGFKGTPYAF